MSEPHFGEIGARVWGGKNGLHSEGRKIPRRGRINIESLPRRRRKHERVSGYKSSAG